ncbi:MAG: cysteine hydrolase [Lachnospiraceae bacterium]|nr:cysteine hydrolase [Lachnospiraceae bacterium]
MDKYLIVVDMQKDFVDGALGTPEAQAVVPAVRAKIEAHGGPVIFTQDTHGPEYLQTQEGRFLPVEHCIRGTEGWEIVPELRDLAVRPGARIIDKPSFGSTVLAAVLTEERDKIESVELIGLCTDICVVSNALMIKAALPEVPLSVDSACCAGVTPGRHEAALETMRSCQITVK